MLSWIGDSQKEDKQGTQGGSGKHSRPGKPDKPKYQRATFHLNLEYIEKLRFMPIGNMIDQRLIERKQDKV